MSTLNIFTSKSPTLGGYELDAVLEDTLDLEVEITGYGIELGARVSDHRIIKPRKWSIVAAVSNNPIDMGVTDFAGGVASNFDESGTLAAFAGLSAGYLAGSNETRASSTLAKLIDLMELGDPFTVDAGDITLTNMVINKLSRMKDPSTEGGLVFTADLVEYQTLSTAISRNQPNSSQLNPDDPSASAISSTKDLGTVATLATTTVATGLVGALL